MPIDKLTKEQRRSFSEALQAAFPARAALAQMVSFQLNENLDNVADGDNLSHVTFLLIRWAETSGRVEELFQGALAQNPDSPELKAFQGALTATAPGAAPGRRRQRVSFSSPPGTRSGVDRFEAIQVSLVAGWYERMQACARAVCRIDLETGFATGFLVGPDLVMTCHHVIQHLLTEDGRPDRLTAGGSPAAEKVVLRFSYAVATPDQAPLSGGESLGQSYSLAPDWLVDGSPGLNYALLRVDGTPGRDLVPAGERPIPRGWIRPAPLHELAVDETLFLLHHPLSRPLSVSYGLVTSLGEDGGQIRYSAMTAPGSSGAPCFTALWRAVALHVGRATTPEGQPDDPLARFGVPLRTILTRPSALGPLLEDEDH